MKAEPEKPPVYQVSISGPTFSVSLVVNEQDDLEIVEAALGHVRAHVAAKAAQKVRLEEREES